MKIIDLGICTDNKDPNGMGRIRCIDYDESISGKENVQDFEKWSDKDPFIALPFLPNNINFIPEEGQAVKLIRYNTDKSTVNQEYIAGPFTTRYDFNNQTYAQQISSTTYGVPFKGKKKFINPNDGTLPEKSKGTLTTAKDFSIAGKNNSDIVFTKDGLTIRGGNLLSQEAANAKQREELLEVPLKSNKVAKLHLKKFPNKLVKVKEKRITEKTESGTLKYIIEYSVDDLSSPETINIYVYKIGNVYGDKFNTKSFGVFTDTAGYPLELMASSGSTVTKEIDLTSIDGYTTKTIENKIKTIGSVMRTLLVDIKTNGFGEFFNMEIKSNFDSESELENIYPLYFRPTFEFTNRSASTTTLKERKQSILNSVKLTRVGPTSHGLIWSQTDYSAPVTSVEENVEILKNDASSVEQTFSSIMSDRIYLISPDTNFTDKTIEFGKLNPYDLTQTDYLEEIDPNTYASVRGEVLLEFLRSMYNVLINHTHTINKPYARETFSEHHQMKTLFEKLENELLNKSIRTN